VGDDRLQLAFAFPVASGASAALAAAATLRNATAAWLAQQPHGAGAYRVARLDAERCEAVDTTPSGGGGSGGKSGSTNSSGGGYYDEHGQWVATAAGAGSGDNGGGSSGGGGGSEQDPLGGAGEALVGAVGELGEGLEAGGADLLDAATEGLSDDLDREARGFTAKAGKGGPRGRVAWANMAVPSFLAPNHQRSRYAGLAPGGGGGSAGGGPWAEDRVGVVLALPCSVLTGRTPLRAIVQYGHGLFDDRSEALEAWLLALADAQGWAVVAADWRGLAKPDLPVVARSLLARPDGFRATADHLLQVRSALAI
jgi:hypothetical protein